MKRDQATSGLLASLPRNKTSLSLIALTAFVVAPTHLGPSGVADRVLVGLLATVSTLLLILRGPQASGVRPGAGPNVLVALAASISFLLGINILLLSLALGYQFGYRDYFELARYPIYVVIALVVMREVAIRPRGVARSVDAVAFTVPVMACLAYGIVALGLPGSEAIVALYADAKTSFRGIGDGRISIPFENPNQLGAASVLSFLWAVAYRSRFSQFTLGVAPVAVLLSGSRGAWIGLLVAAGAFASVLIASQARKKLGRTLVALLAVVGVAAGVVVVVQELPEAGRVSRTLRLIEEGTTSADRNLEGRIDVVTRVVALWSERPVLGQGPQKTEPGASLDAIDSQYASVLVRHGVVGFVLILLFYRNIVLNFVPRFRSSSSLKIKIYLLVSAVLLVPAAHLDAFRFWVFWLLLLAGISVSSDLKSNRDLRDSRIYVPSLRAT